MNLKLIVRGGIYEMLRHSPPELKRKIRKVFTAISEDPSSGKTLQEELQDFRSFKIGRFRVIYRFDHASIKIVSFGPRETIYQQLTLELAQQKSP